MTVWFDADDLIRFFQAALRPTGIQRFSFETYSAAARLSAGSDAIRFCRREAQGLRPIHFPALEAGIRAISASPTQATPPSPPQWPQNLVRLARHVAPRYRAPLARLARAGLTGLGAARELAALSLTSRRPGSIQFSHLGGHAFDLDDGPIIPGPGDWLINLGASWERPYGAGFLTRLNQNGAGFALMAHDMIPDLYPEWCTASMVRDFSAWLDDTVSQADMMFTASRHTARDLRLSLARRGHAMPTSFILPMGGAPCTGTTPPPPPELDQPYVLMVGTIEARKNHAGAMRIWRRLLSTRPPAEVPMLVFAGKPGWLTADLMQQLENADWLGGKIRFINQPSEYRLSCLYAHCLFTLFPSLYEGWGLPVSESLAHGKPVAASSRAAIPEAGGDYCTYFDPDNLDEAYHVVSNLITRPDIVARLRARITANYQQPAWEDTASALLARCGENLALAHVRAEPQSDFNARPEHALQSAAGHA